jgi:hypothetical protein
LQPGTTIVDELRIGTTWASVTPPAEVANDPSLNITRSANTTVLAWPTNAPGFVLESSTTLATPISWSAVVGPIFTIGDQYTVTNVTANGTTFYRLRAPR